MNAIDGIDAIKLANEISNIPDGCFIISFFKCNLTKLQASAELETRKGCKIRSQLPQDKFRYDGDNYFLFNDNENNPKSCYRILLRYIAFPPDFKPLKVNWLS